MDNIDNSSKSRNSFWDIFPSTFTRITFIVLLGILIGGGFAVMKISNAASYLSDDPEACINCHVMTTQYVTWNHSSHRENASCNDCHVPHENYVRKMFFKAMDGMRHAWVFTTRNEPQVMKLNETAKTVIQNNCKRCHIDQVNPVSVANVTGENYIHGEGMLCWSCHREVPHGRVKSQASTPFARVQSSQSNVQDWLRSEENK